MQLGCNYNWYHYHHICHHIHFFMITRRDYIIQSVQMYRINAIYSIKNQRNKYSGRYWFDLPRFKLMNLCTQWEFVKFWSTRTVKQTIWIIWTLTIRLHSLLTWYNQFIPRQRIKYKFNYCHSHLQYYLSHHTENSIPNIVFYQARVFEFEYLSLSNF